jgi:anti-anti-sigma factor
LDLVTAPRLAEMLREATQRARLVVVDLRALTRVDVSGVLTLVSASRSARHDGQRLVLVRGLSKVDRLLALTGASHDVEIIDLAAGEPAVQALLHIERQDRPATRIRARALRRVAPLLGTGPIFRGMDAMIARGARSDFIDG